MKKTLNNRNATKGRIRNVGQRPYIEKAFKMLDKVLSKMQRIQKGKRTLLPKHEFNEIQ